MPAAIDPRPSLTAEPERFSDAAWDLLLASQDQARRWRHGQMDVEHLLQVLFSDPRFNPWIEPLPLAVDELLDALDGFAPISRPAAAVSSTSVRRSRSCWRRAIGSAPTGGPA